MAKGRKDAFTGPIVVLIDSRSASASEVTARVMQIEKRGTVIGDRSAGAVMTSLSFPHTLGQDFYGRGTIAFYGTSITVADLKMSDGFSLEKSGRHAGRDRPADRRGPGRGPRSRPGARDHAARRHDDRRAGRKVLPPVGHADRMARTPAASATPAAANDSIRVIGDSAKRV